MEKPVTLEWISRGYYGILKAPADINEQIYIRTHNLAGAQERVVTPDHELRYDFAASLSLGRCVCDVGCGSGYGSLLLAEHASLVVGFDRHLPSLCEARDSAAGKRCFFVACDFMAMCFTPASFDLVVGFEVVEHVSDPVGLLRTLLNLARPGGRVLFSTPNRAVNSPGWVVPYNPFHMQEWDFADLKTALTELAVPYTVYGQFAAPSAENAEQAPAQRADFVSRGYILCQENIEASDSFVVVLER